MDIIGSDLDQTVKATFLVSLRPRVRGEGSTVHMRTFSPLVFLFCIVTLQGCRHPLVIEGEGDIVELNNSGRGCTLEQFRAGDAACAVNEVTSAYEVNYKAVPRPGWRFLRWEGACSPRSAFQHCALSFSKEDLERWEENHSEDEHFPSKAVFEQIVGQTGFLIAGTPVAGVTYKSPTTQGVTGLDGSFQYAEGERVQFSIGATPLGEVVGKPQLTPFDLAGSPVLTGRDLTWHFTARSAALSRVINLSVLLQSLDRDGEPTNGIEITSGVAALLGGVRLELYTRFEQLGFIEDYFIDQDWNEFQRNSTFRHVIGKANRQQRFSAPHGVVDPGVALKELYKALKVDPRIVAVVQQEDNRQGTTSDVYTYSPGGRVTAHDSTRELRGGFHESWKYNGSGNLARYQRKGEKVADNEERALQYDSLGNLTREQARDTFGDWLAVEHRYLYDADGNLARHKEVENRADDESGTYNKTTHESFFNHSYDAAGRLAQWEEDLVVTDPGGSEHYNVKHQFEYHADGNLRKFTEKHRRLDLPENPPHISWRIFNKHGKLTVTGFGNSVIERLRYNAAGRLKQRKQFGTTWQYLYEEDAEGRVVLQEEIDTASGEIGETVAWQYDSTGNVLQKERLSHSPDSGIGWHRRILETWQYHANGVVSAYEFDERNKSAGFPDLRTIRKLQYDVDGNLVAQAEGIGLDDEAPLRETTSRWQYDIQGNLVAEEHVGQDEYPGPSKTWAYDADGNITRYTEDEDNDGSMDESTSYHYAPVGWGYMVSGYGFTPHVIPPADEFDISNE